MTGVPPPTLVTRKTCPIKVELTVTPYIEIVLTLGPSLLGVTFDIVSMTTKVEFPTTTKLNVADTSSCEVEFDVDVGAVFFNPPLQLRDGLWVTSANA